MTFAEGQLRYCPACVNIVRTAYSIDVLDAYWISSASDLYGYMRSFLTLPPRTKEPDCGPSIISASLPSLYIRTQTHWGHTESDAEQGPEFCDSPSIIDGVT